MVIGRRFKPFDIISKGDMKMLIDEIRKGETASLEFKRDVPRDHLKFLKTAVAFANGTGGRIVFGVDDDRSIVGLDSMAAFKIADGIVDAIVDSCMPLMAVDSEVTTVGGKTVVVIDVANGRHCPYYVKSLGRKNGTFVRVGATSRLAGEDRIRDLEFAGSGQSFDSQICPGLTIVTTELNRLCATMYRTACANCEDAAERKKIKKVTPAQLEDWGILVRGGRKLCPTYAYALLIGSRKFWTEVKCGLFRGTSRAFFRDKREYTGSIIKQIDDAYDFVMDKINVGMKVVGVHGRPDYEMPPSAIRELIVNAIVHRSYINPLAMSVQVALYDDRFEVTAPGGLPHGMSVDMMVEGHSVARNRALALACRYMHIIEAWGSGIPRVNELLLAAGLKPVAIEDNGIDMRFVVWRKHSAWATQENSTTQETAQETTQENFTTQEIPERILALVMTDPRITTTEMARRLGLTRDGVNYHLKALKKAGRLRRVGATKRGVWVVDA